MPHVVLGTAGHIDHGKSTLVQALTGIDPDRLKEEKVRGITIELGFADLDLGDGRTASFVDVPGHERFVRHMVAGASGIDAVVLVVAADAGVQPQTREHLAICDLLGVGKGLVALTKIDLVDDDLREVVELELRDELRGTFLEGATVVPVAAREGLGLDGLRAALADLAAGLPGRDAGGIARLPVDRSFVMRGFGTVVTGTLVAGTLLEGQEVEIRPGGARARIRGLQVHRSKVDAAVAGQRVAVNLQGANTADVPRGAVLVRPGVLRSTRRLWARVRWLPHVPSSLRSGGLLRFHQGTAERGARFRVLAAREEDAADLEFFLDDEAVLVPGDRFILRQTAPLDTVGGGVVLDVRPPRSRAARRDVVEIAQDDPEDALAIRLSRSGRTGTIVSELAGDLGRTESDLEGALRERSARGLASPLAGRWFDGRVLDEAERDLLAALDAYHRKEPLRSGISRESVRGAVCPDMPVEAWRAWLDGLATRGTVRLAGDRLASGSHEVVLSETERAALDRIDRRFLESGLEPPDPAELAGEEGAGTADRLIDLLLERGRLVRIRDGRPFHAEALEGLYRRLLEHRRTSTTIDVGGFKELFGVTRKNAIPLLEHLDGERRTRRVGNAREILEV